MSKRDPELNHESNFIQAKYPYARSKEIVNPVFSRVRTSMRTKEDFDYVEKYKIKERPKNIPEGLSLEEENEAKSNRYVANRRSR